jgi:tRNA-splicing ligase RtcB
MIIGDRPAVRRSAAHAALSQLERPPAHLTLQGADRADRRAARCLQRATLIIVSRDEDRIRGGDVRAAGIADGPAMGVALSCLPRAVKVLGREEALRHLSRVAFEPDAHAGDPYFAKVAQRLIDDAAQKERAFVERGESAPLANFCPNAESGAMNQMLNSLRLPSAVRGALMPDAHQGYGLPIGGVLETAGTIIPYAVLTES